MTDSKKNDQTEMLECGKCDFKTKSKAGLKTHMKRKHIEIEKETFPKSV